MKKMTQNILGPLGMVLAMVSFSAGAFEPGQQVTQAQLAQWGELPVYDIGANPIRVLPEQPKAGQTLVLNAQGIVGISRNEVLVAKAQEDQIRSVAGRAAHAPASVQHFAPTGLTVLTYANFAQAVAGLETIKAGLPDATVRLPVQFSKPVPY